jgi:serine/threonine protein kinase
MTTPARQLLGRTLPNGWHVAQQLPHPQQEGGTGGNFSAGYIVEKDGRQAFLKALDFSKALQAPDPARALQALTEMFNFERDVLVKCRNERLSRIVMALDDGNINVDPQRADGIVQYIIFELAEGDVRKQLQIDVDISLAWRLRTLHQVAVGLTQLHGRDITHQDLKPSNVLLFSKTESKLSDLGRAAYKGHIPPHTVLPIQGDPAYAPPEQLYGYSPSDWNLRHFGCDAYLMGSMIVYFFSDASVTSLLLAHLDAQYHPGRWTDTYPAVLPYLRDAFAHTMETIESDLPGEFQSELSAAIRQLCDPDSSQRGHPRTRAQVGNPLALERYVSLFNQLSLKAEIKVYRATL